MFNIATCRFDSDNEVTDSEDEHEKELLDGITNRDEDDSEEEVSYSSNNLMVTFSNTNFIFSVQY